MCRGYIGYGKKLPSPEQPIIQEDSPGTQKGPGKVITDEKKPPPEQAGKQGFTESGVQALFYGHDHVFTDIVADGIHYVCIGSAGAPWKFGTEETGYERFWTSSGFTWVDVSQESLTVSFVGANEAAAGGQTLHSFVIPREQQDRKGISP